MRADYHVHTEFSDDSDYAMEKVIQDSIAMGLDEMPLVNVHYPTYYETFKEMWALYHDKIELKLGLEFGMQAHTIEKYEKLFARFPFDFIILSVHEVEDKEFWTQDFQRGRTQKEYNERYYEELLYLVENYHNYSVFGTYLAHELIGGVLVLNKKITTEKRLSVRLYLSLFIHAVVGYGLVVLLDYIFSKSDNSILAWLHLRTDVIFIVYLIMGFVCIFKFFWKKPWGYLDEVISATQTVYEQNNHVVALSDPLKELENQLNQIKMSVLLSKQAAKQAEDKKNEIIMYLAHDIRTPLTTVIGYLSLLHEAPDMPEKQKEKYVKVALDKADRLEKLINELFEITKYNAHTVVLKREIVDLHCLIAQVIDEIYPTLSANGNTAVFTADDDLSINGDPEKLARVFSNLLKNAAAYSYPQTEISISAKRSDRKIQITFENHGKTIAPEQLDSIFEKFSRLDEARLSDTGGAGLGLSISEEIIHLHGGTITASSENESISFIITLPISS